MSFQKKACLFILCISFHLFSFSQKKKYEGIGAINEFVMPAKATIVGHFDLFYEAKIPNAKGDKRAFWYKAVFNKDCFFKFNLFPLVVSDRYDFRLFKVENNANFCEAVVNQSVYYIPDAHINRTWHDSEQTKAFRDNLVFTKQINVKKGDAIYIEIINLWGSDAGHVIDFNTCDYSYVLKAIKDSSLANNADSAKLVTMIENWDNDKKEIKDAAERIKNTLCPPNGIPVKISSINFTNEGAEVKSRYSSNGNLLFSPPKKLEEKRTQSNKQPVNNTPEMAIKNIDAAVTDYSKSKFIVINNISGDTVDVKLKITEELKGKEIVVKPTKQNGVFDIFYEKNKKYKVECNAVGYKNFDQTMDFGKIIASLSKEVIIIKLEPYQSGQNFVLKNISFHPNTPVIKAESKKEMDNLYKYLKNNPAAIIEISGHTNGNSHIKAGRDKSGLGKEWAFSGSSKKLSVMRAKKVKEYLVEKGIAAQRLKIQGYGGDRPIYPDASNQEEIGKNIRVEILLLKT